MSDILKSKRICIKSVRKNTSSFRLDCLKQLLEIKTLFSDSYCATSSRVLLISFLLVFIFSCSDSQNLKNKKVVKQNKKQEIRKELLKKRKENFKIKYEYLPMREVKSEKRKALEKDMKRRGYCNAC